MRVITVQGLGDPIFEGDLRRTLLKEMPAEAEVYVSATADTCKVETRVVFDGGSATLTVCLRDLGEVTTDRILKIVRELVFMLPNQTPSLGTNLRFPLPSNSEEHSLSFRQAVSSNGYHHKSEF